MIIICNLVFLDRSAKSLFQEERHNMRTYLIPYALCINAEMITTGKESNPTINSISGMNMKANTNNPIIKLNTYPSSTVINPFIKQKGRAHQRFILWQFDHLTPP